MITLGSRSRYRDLRVRVFPPSDRQTAVTRGLGLVMAGWAVLAALSRWGPEADPAPLPVPFDLVVQLAAIALVATLRVPRPLLIPLALAATFVSANSAVLAYACLIVTRNSARGWVPWLVGASAGLVLVNRLAGGLLPIDVPLLVATVVWLPGLLGNALHTTAGRRDLLLRNAELRADQAAARERALIQRELHDTVAHGVTLMMLRAGALEVSARDEETRRAAVDLQDTAQSTLDDIRAWYAVLREGASGEQPDPSTAASADLRELVDRVAALGTAVDATGAADTLARAGRGTRLAAYRIAQEAVTNAVKYAPGAAVEVRVRVDGERLRLRVRNDPPARPADRLVPGTGLGLAGLQERARLLGGTVRFGPTHDGGFLVEADLPKDA
ncbi:sensor histidine kinase [Streptomyces sp. NPDC090025]|uniref:sensor histidine kinase n=1 Tax=Streptomyces sp. NPDC090025 TaxID=3365922 RepID=UPI003832C0B3